MLMRVVLAIACVLGLVGCATGTDAGEPQVTTGEYDKEQIRSSLRDRLKSRPGLEGKLVRDWELDAEGRVAAVAVGKSLDPEVDMCVAGEVRKIKFPPGPSRSIVRSRYPVWFTTRSGGSQT